MIQDLIGELRVGGKALQHEFLHAAAHAPDRRQARGRKGDHLRRQRVIIRRQRAAGIQAGIHAHAVAAGKVQKFDRARAGAEAALRVLRVDAALNRMAADADILLRKPQREAGGDAQLLLHDVHARDHLRDAVLDLDAGVHLHEVEMLPVAVQQKFDRARALVADGPRRANGGLAHRRAHLRRDAPGRGLLDELLVAPLHGAVAVAQVNDVSMPVGENLHLDVARPLHELFQVQLALAKAGDGLGARLRKAAPQLLRAAAAPDPPPAAAGGGLEQHGIADALRRRERLLLRFDRAVGARRHRHARRAHERPGGGLAPRLANRLGRRADERQPLGRAGLREIRVLGEEAVAGMDGVAAGGLRHGQQRAHVQIALRRRSRADADRLRRQLHVHGLRVRRGIDGDGLHAQLPAGAQNPQRDFAPVGDQHAPQHGL